ncbi:SAM-dependent methyltransferase [Saccharopolyspora rhizosphaerae]|uniref:SAM-dependent methyltransferase n=1 Tax=Saccharopolyspora rhizosphaerae TaxID=2492662 RepID=A0A426JNB9_9PSEU|nr:SAM-dependent methyltransferase [Saccharopolyspora rhizosphaerae]RRO14732.1 SAM-dependent methyltransferase [Saccharopolyspora rhizosphaerae]
MAEGVQDLRTDVAHGARIYDYILGGKDNYAVDRAAAEASQQVWPALPVHMRANREFMHRAGRFLATERGVDQFLDIGTGIPTSPNLHEVVQEVEPEARVVYTDNDPIVLAHARALMSRTGQGRTAYVEADLRDPDTILSSREFRETLDPDRPIALMLIAVVHFIEDDDEALDVVRRIVEVLPSGSYVAATIATDDYAPELLAEVRRAYHEHGETLKFRDHDQALRFFDGLEVLEPGVVQVHKWRPDDPASLDVPEADIAMYAGIARKP